MADQATLTGHPEQALQLARAGRIGLQTGHSPACLADLYALQARAEAAMGDRKAAIRSILASQKAAEQVVPSEEAERARFIPGAYLNGEYANAFNDLKMAAEATHFGEISAREAAMQNRARRGALAYAAQARSALSQHDLEVACFAAAKTFDLSENVSSSRTQAAVRELEERLSGHKQSRIVAQLLDKFSTV